MARYILVYCGGRKPETPEQGAKDMERWKAWVQGLGQAVVNPGTPISGWQAVSAGGVADSGGPAAMNGFSVVEADSLDAALEMAKNCPFTEQGTIEVGEMHEMPG